jgi:hypothetical protein
VQNAPRRALTSPKTEMPESRLCQNLQLIRRRGVGARVLLTPGRSVVDALVLIVNPGHAIEQSLEFFAREIPAKTSDARSDLGTGARDRFSFDLVHLPHSPVIQHSRRVLQDSVREIIRMFTISFLMAPTLQTIFAEVSAWPTKSSQPRTVAGGRSGR